MNDANKSQARSKNGTTQVPAGGTGLWSTVYEFLSKH